MHKAHCDVEKSAPSEPAQLHVEGAGTAGHTHRKSTENKWLEGGDL